MVSEGLTTKAATVGLNIIYTGVNLIRRSFSGLMDSSLSEDEIEQIKAAIADK